MTVRIASWNIWKGKNLPAVKEFLANQSADIICLQEVTEFAENGQQRNIARELADSLGYTCVYHKAVSSNRPSKVYDLGNAILTRLSVITSVCHFLNDPDGYQGNSLTEPRICNEIVVDTDTQQLRILNTHLAYSDRLEESIDRTQQITALLPLLEEPKTVLVGDFNCELSSPQLKKIAHKLKNADPDPTAPTWSVFPTEYQGFKVEGLRYRIDHAFVSKDLAISDFKIKKTVASDHLPLVFNINLP